MANKTDSNKPEDTSSDNEPKEPVNTDIDDAEAIYQKKIKDQEGVIAAKDAAIAELTGALKASKATNFNLLMEIPKDSHDNPEPHEETVEEIKTYDDLFERKRIN